MRRLSQIIALLFFPILIFAQSPHGGNLKYDCSDCHNSNNWKVVRQDLKFDHQKTKFPLMGQHRLTDCKECHTDLDFFKEKENCSDCHKDVHKNSVSNNCSKCHTSTTWLVLRIDQLHEQSRFPLIGNHRNQSCQLCHAKYPELNFEPLGIACYNCHSKDYQSSQKPNHTAANYSRDCTACHKVTDVKWNTTGVNHDFFPLTAGHNVANCFACHTNSTLTKVSKDCFSCHQKDFNRPVNPNHVTGKFPTTCIQCHSINAWKPSTFDHSLTSFPLVGKHSSVTCSSCHATGFAGTKTNCYSCHKSNYDATKNPIHTSAGFQTTCSDCHTPNGWTPATFDHDGKYFPVYSGAHKGKWNVCTDCHITPSNYANFSCINCHEHNQQQTNSDHKSISGYVYLSSACYSCHKNGSKNGAFNHSTTAFPLTGKHLGLSCESCHKTSTTLPLTDCNSCHSSKFISTVNPNHTSIGVSTDCKSCHNTNGWTPSTFNHSNTAYVLSGQHINASCASCHKGKTIGTSQVCFDCHSSKFTSTVNPNHASIGISTDCKSCHNTTGWTPSTFNHANTTFVLSGAHINTACSSCHQGKTTGISNLCYSCHQTKFTSVVDPNHVTGKFPTACEQCHTTTAWKPASFNHSTTRFPLTGKHATATCIQCHATSYTNTSMDCYSCHKTNFNNSVNPNHIGVGISTDCAKCHNANGWTPSTFNHSSTAFVLSGQHINTGCILCHKGKTTGTSPVCYDCHTASYDQSLNPKHKTIGISTDCKSCHNSSAWIPSTFSHTKTAFILTGAHIITACESCHQGKTTGTSILCYSCHQIKFNSVIGPNHVTGKFPTTCEQCHSTTAWKPATFNHASTIFPLTGKHTTVACIQCHAAGYANTPTDCYSCHKTNYNSSINPNHSSAQFPTTCADCHTTNGWTPSTFNHDGNYFRIYSGAHRGRWTLCSSCHNVPSNYKQYTCTTSCHPKAQMDSAHRNRTGYLYESTACFSCHRNT